MTPLARRRPAPPPPADAFLPRPVPADPDLVRAYFAQVTSFEADRLRSHRRTARLGVAFGIAGVLVGLVAVTAAASILPLKTVLPPLVFRVDNVTGAVERVYDVAGGAMAASEAVRRYYVWQYVRYRQGYAAAEAQASFEAVTLLSAPAVQQAFAAEQRDPHSPPARLGPDGTVTLRWVSTVFLGDQLDLAQVRFVQLERKGDTDLPPRLMVATVAFTFAAGAVDGAALNVNPLGFLVTSYHVDQEAVP